MSDSLESQREPAILHVTMGEQKLTFTTEDKLLLLAAKKFHVITPEKIVLRGVTVFDHITDAPKADDECGDDRPIDIFEATVCRRNRTFTRIWEKYSLPGEDGTIRIAKGPVSIRQST